MLICFVPAKLNKPNLGYETEAMEYNMTRQYEYDER
jgi:hypothetical protein